MDATSAQGLVANREIGLLCLRLAASLEALVNLDQALTLRDVHRARLPTTWQRWRNRPVRCQACRQPWPCAPHRWARARVLHLVREAFSVTSGIVR
jgi:hypothetical protein